jgi:ABC-type Fe3+ transport system substrate-binding protein
MFMAFSRRALLGLVLLAIACGPSASAPAPAKPASQPAAQASPAAKPATGNPAAQPAAKPAADGPAAEWERTKEAAKREGSVVVAGPGEAQLRQAVTDGFQKAHGITVEYIGLSSGEMQTRVDREQRAGQPSIDVHIGGTTTCWNMAERGYIEPIAPEIVDPAVLNPAVWRDGKPRFLSPLPAHPPDFNCAFQFAEWVNPDLMVNTQMIPPGTLTSWRDLLKPEFKGKITAYDPRASGPGQSSAAYLLIHLGDDFVRDLYLGQEVVLSRDNRQLAESVARGSYAAGIGMIPQPIEQFRALGLPLQRVFPADGRGYTTAGFGSLMKMKGAPHPNATKVFINWYLTKEGQDIHEAAMLEPSLRTDVVRKAPDYIVPQPGEKYDYDNSDPDFFFNKRVPANQKLVDILGR